MKMIAALLAFLAFAPGQATAQVTIFRGGSPPAERIEAGAVDVIDGDTVRYRGVIFLRSSVL